MSAAAPFPQPRRRRPTDEELLALARDLAELHDARYGASVDDARGSLAGDVLTVVLSGGLSTADRSLLENGRSEALVVLRRSFYEAVGPTFRGLVEAVLSRRVESYSASFEVERRSTTLVFVLGAGDALLGDEWDAITAWSRQVRVQARRLRVIHREQRARQRELTSRARQAYEKTHTRKPDQDPSAASRKSTTAP